MQRDNADVIRQLNHLQDQMVVAGESLYVALGAMEIQEANLRRQGEALDRTAAEMELRYGMGQISAMQLAEVKAPPPRRRALTSMTQERPWRTPGMSIRTRGTTGAITKSAMSSAGPNIPGRRRSIHIITPCRTLS